MGTAVKPADFAYKNKPLILFEEERYAVLYKPRGMPTAPLRSMEKNSLLYWFLTLRPKAAGVFGKKKIEAGLIHRLDTPTCGLVLIAKTQKAFNAIHLMQERNLIEKTYFAFTEKSASQIPPVIESQFRAFGPKGRKTVPVFRSSKRFEPGKKTYHTKILEIKEAGTKSAVTCSLTQGFRHQVRTHLASAGMPICGDALYSPFFDTDFPNTLQKDIVRHLYPLQLYAVGITFPDLSWTNVNRKNINDKKSAATITASKETSSHSKISFWLPPPDKMIR